MTNESREVLKNLLMSNDAPGGGFLMQREIAALQDAIDTAAPFEPLRVEPATAGSEKP